MNRTFPSLLALIAAVAIASACGSERERTVLIPTTPSATVRTTSPSTPVTGVATLPVGTYSSVNTLNPAGRLPNGLSTCTNVVLNVTSSTPTQATGTLTMTCPGNLTVSGTIVGQLGAPVIPITYTGTTNDNGDTCQFQLSGTGTPLGNDYYRLDFTGNSTCQGPFTGSEVIRFNNNPSPTPTPTPTPTPNPAPAADMVPLSSAIIKNSPQNLASWPITSAIRAVHITASGIGVDFAKKDGPGRWPDVVPPGWDGPLQYTLGMMMNINGQNYASAPVQYWYGLVYSGGPPSQYALNWFYDPGRWAPMTYHQPAVGEQIGIFACAGNCRNDVTGAGSPVKERTNVVVVTMPTDAGAYFQF